MKIDNRQTDVAIMMEIGKRLARQRLTMNVTQAELAYQAGVSKSTLERIETGKSVQLSNFIRILRSLDLIRAMDAFLPESKPGPMELLRNKKKERKRANPDRKKKQPDDTWCWGDDA